MRPKTSRSAPFLTLFLAGTALALACTKAPPPAPTSAWVQSGRPGVTVQRGPQTLPVEGALRIEEDSVVQTPAGVRSSLFLDRGAWVLMDEKTTVQVGEKRIDVRAGRVWIDARGGDEVEISAGSGKVVLNAKGAGLSVTQNGSDAQIYCAAGQVTWHVGAQGGRLESGLSLLLKNGEARETAQALWDDWTYGLAEPGPLRPLEAAGVGQLSARRPGDLGTARTPLIVRQHDVRVRIERDLAITEIEQTFFNPRSEHLEGQYNVRLPERAILQEFAVGQEDSTPQVGSVVASVRAGTTSPYDSFTAQLEWAGAGRYRGIVRDIHPGKTKVVRLRYAEWLPHYQVKGSTGSRRTYVYPMGQSAAALTGNAPNLGEFSLEVDVNRAEISGLSAGLGAKNEGSRVVMRRSDFRPAADFVLDLIDAKSRKGDRLEAYRSDGEGARYFFTQPVLDAGSPPEQLDVALVVDVSAATDEARLDLGRAAAQALLQQLRPQDRVAVLAASTTPASLGRDAMGPASKERVNELIGQLSKQTPGGASNLEAALLRAVELLPRGKGTVIYIGDGRPTVGALLPGDLRDRLARLGALPRFYAVAVGSDANLDLLGAICDAGRHRGVIRVEDRPEAARAALHLIERAALPSLTEVRIALGEEADVVYPEAAVSLEGGEALPIVARLRRDRTLPPSTLTVTGLRDGKPFTTHIPLLSRDIEDSGDVSRRWAQARLFRLLERGAGREAVLDIGSRFALVTPWTAVVVGGSGGDAYAPQVGEEESGLFVPPALRGQAPSDATVALEPGVSTRTLRVTSLDDLYVRALREREAPARLCYERRAAGHPELSGRVVLRVKVAVDGIPKEAKVVSSTLRARDVDACIERAVAGLKLPVAPDGKPHEVTYSLQLSQPDHDEGSRGCSAASRAYLSTRRTLWRERLSRTSGVAGAMNVWNEAESRCELRSWLDRRALLDLMRPAVGRTAQQVDLYHRFEAHEQQAEIQAYLRREILRAVRTEDDVRAAQYGLSLDGGIDPTLLAQELNKAKTVAEKLEVVRRFLSLSPMALSLKLKLLALLEEAGQKDEARRLVDSLRSDPGADASVRQAIGEFLMRSGDGADGARAFSEIVEFAPFDPWGRRRLGDLYRASRLFEPAYREYQTLGWLNPQDDTVLLLLAGAAAGSGRSDEALRLSARVAEAVGARSGEKGVAAWARALYAALYARLRLQAAETNDARLQAQLLARGRSDGVAGYAGKLLFAVQWTHPDAGVQLYLAPPSQPKGDGDRAALQGADVGIESQRLDRIEAGTWRLTVRKTGLTSGPVSVDLFVLQNAGEASERVRRKTVEFPATSDSKTFNFSDGDLR